MIDLENLPDDYTLLEESDIKTLNVDERMLWGSLNNYGKERILLKARRRYERELVISDWKESKDNACAEYVRLLASAAGKKGEEKEEITKLLNNARKTWLDLKNNKPK